MEDFFLMHQKSFDNVELVSLDTRREVEEIIGLLEMKCECEMSYARYLRKLGQYRLPHLTGSVFEPVVESIKNKALNKCFQQMEMVENMRRDVVEPLKQSIQTHGKEAKQAGTEGKQSMRFMKDAELHLKKLKNQYLKSAKEAEEAIRQYDDFKRNHQRETNPQQRDKLFYTMNSKTRACEEKAKGCENYVQQINAHLRAYSTKMKQLS